jgi:hypothetical protein
MAFLSHTNTSTQLFFLRNNEIDIGSIHSHLFMPQT